VTNIRTAGTTIGVDKLRTSTNVTIEGDDAFIDGFSVGIETAPSTSEVVAEDFNVVEGHIRRHFAARLKPILFEHLRSELNLRSGASSLLEVRRD
jgi:hypothetical protein